MHNPITFMAQERSIVETAFAGDIVGLHDKGAIQVGDTFTEGEQFQVTEFLILPPELFRKVRLNENHWLPKHSTKASTSVRKEPLRSSSVNWVMK